MRQEIASLSLAQKARAIAKWWSAQLKTTPQHDIGYGKDYFAAYFSSDNKNLSQQQIADFEKSLKQIISSTNPECVFVDYDPCPEIMTALAEAGISAFPLRLPVKTYTFPEDLTFNKYYKGKTIKGDINFEEQITCN
ncbi:MAG: hypothetical protein F6J93_03645 [Oscillatoria sp. SIO1A7]|nr:hypothetical protein [Oscillatoria sp. SIO1A7]